MSLRTTIASVLLAPLVAEADPALFIQKDACPFECCEYGEWKVVARATVYASPSTTAPVLGTIDPGSTVPVPTGEVHVLPGLARMTRTPHTSAEGLDPEKEIEILDYVGEGSSRVRQGGTLAQVKIARSRKECAKDPDARWRYCWAEVLREPVTEWWVVLGAGSEHPGGWLLMETGALRAIDGCG